MLMAIEEVLRGQELPPGIARFIAEPFNVVTLRHGGYHLAGMASVVVLDMGQVNVIAATSEV